MRKKCNFTAVNQKREPMIKSMQDKARLSLPEPLEQEMFMKSDIPNLIDL